MSSTKKSHPHPSESQTTAPDIGTVESYQHDQDGPALKGGFELDGQGEGGYHPGEAYGVENIMPRVSSAGVEVEGSSGRDG